MFNRFFLVATLVGCSPAQTNAPDASAPACAETVTEVCATKGLVVANACTMPPSTFVVSWSATGYACSKSTCGAYTVITYGGQTDSDSYELYFSGDALVQVLVRRYPSGAVDCIAGSSNAINVNLATDCTSNVSCNEPCTLDQVGACSTSTRCGPTTMKKCDGTTQVFVAGCACTGGSWWCDGTKIDACPVDAGVGD